MTKNKKPKENQETIKETNKRSIVKSILWRIMGVFVYATIFYLFTKQWGITIAGTLIHHSTFLVVFLKPFTYEIVLGMGLGGLIVLLLTGSWKSVTQITLTYTGVKLIMYFIYDKIWNKIKWGTK